MRFVRVNTSDGPRVGVLDDADDVHLSPADDRLEPHLHDGADGLRALGGEILHDPADVVPLTDLDPVIPLRPTSMRDFMTFEEHILPSWKAAGLVPGPAAWYERPVGYFSNVASILGPSDPVEIPGGCEWFDFELEVGAVVGREARSTRAEDAADHLAGYLVLVDWSARDLQRQEMTARLGPFKGKDFASSLGPILVTPDHLADRREGTGFDLKMTAYVNGQELGGDIWSSASWSFEEMLSYASWNSVVEAGALLGSGTCQGGCILELFYRHGAEAPAWLTAGDVVRLEIELFGAVEADVRPPARGPWPHLRQASQGSEGS